MVSEPVRALIVGDDRKDYIVARSMLSEIESTRYGLDWAATYEAAMEAIRYDQHDVYLIDCCIGDRSGLELLAEALRTGCRAPIIMTTDPGDRKVGVEAVKVGAADYLVKGDFDASLLERSIRYSVSLSRVEKEKAVLQEQLSQSQKMVAVGQLASGVAHDFNNLLTAVLGYAQLGASMSPEQSQIKSHFQEIQKAGQQATDLTRQLLAFSRHETAERLVVTLNDLIVNTHKMLRRLIGEDIELVTLASPDLRPVRVDPSQLGQVLINLAVNARDAMPGGGKLTIETYNVTIDDEHVPRHAGLAPGHQVVLAITDNGSGMTGAVTPRIFEPFFTTKQQGEGTGLGLSTCYAIVKSHDGHISVYSEPGHGTTIKVYLPAVGEATGDHTHGRHSALLPRGREMVLVAEDEETVRGMAARVLRNQGYTVLEAENGGEALRVAEEFAERDIGLDLLLTDVIMPIMGGRELAYRLKARHAATKVLYTSGYTDASIIHNGQMDPGIESLPKPFTPDLLARRVRDVLDGSTAPQADGL